MSPRNRHRIVLVTGGARSGKTTYAVRLAERWWKRPAYLATAEAFDAEMAERIKHHRRSRGPHWTSVEEALNIAPIIRKGARNCDGILLDCVTIWLCNILTKEGPTAVKRRKDNLLDAIAKAGQDIILVTNEVGSGIVPANKLAREFRDRAGWMNQALAECADTVVLVVAGLPIVLKGRIRR